MKNIQGILLIIVVVLIFFGEILRNNIRYEIIGKVFTMLALAVAIISAFLKSSKLKKSYAIVMLIIAALFLLYPVIF